MYWYIDSLHPILGLLISLGESKSLIERGTSHKCYPKHMIWALYFIKVYSTESAHDSMEGVSEKTF